jgi:hypothetical protein
MGRAIMNVDDLLDRRATRVRRIGVMLSMVGGGSMAYATASFIKSCRWLVGPSLTVTVGGCLAAALYGGYWWIAGGEQGDEEALKEETLRLVNEMRVGMEGL